MSNNASSRSSGGIGFCGLLAIIFITLKLLGITAVANWSWIWVLSPLWIGLALTLGILLVVLVVGSVAAVIISKKIKK